MIEWTDLDSPRTHGSGFERIGMQTCSSMEEALLIPGVQRCNQRVPGAVAPQRRRRFARAEGPTTGTATNPLRKRRYQPKGGRAIAGMADVYLIVPHAAIGPTGLKPGNTADVKKRTAGLRTNGLDAWWPEPFTCPAEKYEEVESRFRDYVYDRMDEMGYVPEIVNEAVNFSFLVTLEHAKALAESLVAEFRAILDAEVLAPYVAA